MGHLVGFFVVYFIPKYRKKNDRLQFIRQWYVCRMQLTCECDFVIVIDFFWLYSEYVIGDAMKYCVEGEYSDLFNIVMG